MADVELVIKIPKELYDLIQDKLDFNGDLKQKDIKTLMLSIDDGTPLPKGHGDLIDRNLALSDDGLCEFHMYDDYVKMRNYLKSIPPIIKADKAESEDKE